MGELWHVDFLVGTVESVLELANGYVNGSMVSNLREQGCPSVTVVT